MATRPILFSVNTTGLTNLLLQLSLMTVIVSGDFNLTVLHTNDVHGRVEQIDKYGANCTESDAELDQCYGGVARRYTAIEEIRRNHSNTLLLDAGDEFQGTIWFSYYNGLESSHFMNRLRYDAMTLGNHDFDNGASGLLSPFLENTSFPVVTCNVNFTNYPEIESRIRPYITVNVGGDVVGIIGYTTPETAVLADPRKIENLTFNDILPCVRQSVSELQDQGVNKIIALGHSGYSFSQQVAEIPGVDIVIDGHSHTFLYSGEVPSNEKPSGPYPTEVVQSDGGKALVYQAYAYGKYLGFADVTFDDDGRVIKWSGNPLLLDKTWRQDPGLLEEIGKWREPLIVYTKVSIGESYVALEGGKHNCRVRECSLGNLLTDAVWHEYLRPPTVSKWTPVRIVIWNGGSIRISLKKGAITTGDLIEVHPFRNKVELIWITGATLNDILEHSVTDINPDDPPGRFLQLSGVKVVYDLSQPEGSRVMEVKVVCIECDVPVYRPLDDNMTYPLLTNDYLTAGGDGYTVLKDNIIRRQLIDMSTTDILVSYVKWRSPIVIGDEGRIVYKESGDERPVKCPVNRIAVSRPRSHLMLAIALCMVIRELYHP